jgi:hypothetical protein
VRYTAGVVLDGEDLALASVLARLGVAYLQRVNGSAPAAAVRLRDQLQAFARETTSVLISDERETAKPAAVVVVGESLPQMMTVRAAAGLLGISPQAARGLCRAGDLLATRSPAGAWQIDADSAAALAARRKERNDQTAATLPAALHHPGHQAEHHRR